MADLAVGDRLSRMTIMAAKPALRVHMDQHASQNHDNGIAAATCVPLISRENGDDFVWDGRHWRLGLVVLILPVPSRTWPGREVPTEVDDNTLLHLAAA